MAQFPALFKRAFLRNLWEGCPEATSLSDALISASRSQVQQTEGGYLITSHSGAGVSTQFQVPQIGGLTPQTLAELCEDLITRYEEAADYLAVGLEVGSATEADIYAEMLSRLRPIRRVRSDFSTMGAFR